MLCGKHVAPEQGDYADFGGGLDSASTTPAFHFEGVMPGVNKGPPFQDKVLLAERAWYWNDE